MKRLSSVAPKLIHKSQVAFISGRSTFDQIDLAMRVLQLCNISDQNTDNQCGVIVLLDQEKAYDKIKHDCLWNILEAVNIPDNFISLIKALYSDARTTIILNGTL